MSGNFFKVLFGQDEDVGTSVHVDPCQEANAACARGDYAKALHLCLPLAKAGNPGAQHNLAVMYNGGQGTPQDFGQAAFWYRKAADQGHPGAPDHVQR